MLDGSGDAEDQFSAMGDAIATARMDLNVDISFNPWSMIRGSKTFVRQGWAEARATWHHKGAPEKCLIDYVKAVLPAHHPWDLHSYRQRNPDFPAETFKFEEFDEFDFEAYRKLGYGLVSDALVQSWNLRDPDSGGVASSGTIGARVPANRQERREPAD